MKSLFRTRPNYEFFTRWNTENFGFTAILVKYIVMFCVPKHAESFGSDTRVAPCTSG